MRSLTPLLLAIALGACYQLDASSGKFRCDQPGDGCPAGLQCLGGLCRAPIDSETPAPDLGPGPDAPLPTGGCTASGVLLQQGAGAEVHACKGRFSRGQAGGLCRTGYHLCGTQDERVLAAIDGEGRCSGLGGFFAAQIEAALSATDQLVCQPAQGDGLRRVLLGCGFESEGTRQSAVPCRGLQGLLGCEGAPAGWSCTSKLADTEHTDATKGGVLCCKG